MLTYEQLIALIEKGKDAGVDEIKALGANIKFHKDKVAIRKTKGPVLDLKADEIFKPVSPLDDLTPEEVLYYATPHYDEIQADKQLRESKLKEKSND